MIKTEDYSKEKGLEQHILPLPDNRQLAYARNGPPTSRIVIIFFTGLFSVGIAPDVPKPCREIEAQWISPTLPGMGNSSIRQDLKEPYHVALARDMTALLSHLYPTNDFDTLYVSGGSYGTVQAQMLYGAPYDLFPAGRKIAGCILLGGFAPVYYHKNYAKSLSWQNWFSFGPPAHSVPGRPFQWIFRSFVSSKFKTVQGAKEFLDQAVISRMEKDEKQWLAEWLETRSMTKEEWLDQMAEGAITCCKRWDGFMEVADVIHSDWGYNPATLDDSHATKPMLVVGSKDDNIGGSTDHWIVENYRSAKLKMLPGGHISCMFFMDEIWAELFAWDSIPTPKVS